MREKKNKKRTGGEDVTFSQNGPLSVSFGSLLSAESRRSEPEEEKRTAVEEKERAQPAGASKISKVALRRERAGRGGKTVTIVTLPRDYGGDAASLARELRKALGCGSSMEEGNIVLQGDIIERVEAWFVKKGVKNVSKSGCKG